jgi:O-antigen/teichoic acid export membrane protein
LATLLGNWFAEDIVVLIYGPGYQPAIFVFKVLVWAIIFQYMSNLCGILLTSMDKVRINMNVMTIAVIFKLTLNFFLIPIFGMVAASIITVITEFLVFAIMFVYLEIFFRKPGYPHFSAQEVVTTN